MTIQRHTETVRPVTTNAPHDLTWLALVLPEWTRDAVCASVDPELFFPDKGGSTREAKSICARCPVAAECLDYALAYEGGERGVNTSYAEQGIYGGLSPRERRALRKELGRMSTSTHNGTKTHCVRGHEFTAENTYERPSGGRTCRTCNRRSSTEYKQQEKSA